MIWEQLPDIPRLYTGVAEWAACLVYVLLASRCRRATRVATSIAAAPIIVFWQLLADALPEWAWVGGMLVAAALMWLFIAVGTGLSFTDTGYLTARAFLLAEFVASLHWQLHMFAFQSTELITAYTVISIASTYGLCFLAAYLVERRHISRDHPLSVDGRSLTLSIIIALIAFLVSNLSFFSPNTPFSGRASLEIFYIRTLVDLAGFAALYAQQGQRLESRRAAELQATTFLLNTQHEQYLQSRRNIDQVNRKYHDLKHYIAAIRAESSAEKRSTFLDQLEDSIHGYEYEINTGNAVVNAILGPKLARCHELNVNITAVVDGAALSAFDTMSLSALLGNALDNAIDATSSLPQDKRLIKVTAYRKDLFVLLKIENNFEGAVEMVDGVPLSTKDASLGHGYGAQNMRSIVESLGGSLSIKAEDSWFTVLVLLPTGE